MDKTFYFSSQKFPLNAFGRPIFFFSLSGFIRTSCYVKHITGNSYRLHSSGIMRAITGDLGRMQDEWGLSLGFASEVSTLCFLTTHCCRIPLDPLHGGTKILQCSSHGRKKKTQQKRDVAPPVPSVFFCRKQTDGSIKAAAPYTLGKIAVRFVTFK